MNRIPAPRRSASISRLLWLAALFIAVTTTSIQALDRAALGGLPTIIVDGVNCNLSDAIRAANDASTIGGCTGTSGLDLLVLDVDVVLASADTTSSTFQGGAYAGLPDVTSGIVLSAGAGETVERDPLLPCGALETSSFRLVNVTPSGSLYLFDLVLRNGCVAPASGVTGHGGAIHLEGGALELHGTLLEGNTVHTTSAPARGGALRCASGTVASVVDSTFRGNLAHADAGSVASGGAASLGCTVGSLIDSIVEQNSAIGGSGGRTGAFGGGFSLGNFEEMTRMTFLDNVAIGSSNVGLQAGEANGGAMITGSGGPITSSVFRGNQAISGDISFLDDRERFARGGAIDIVGGLVTLINGCLFEANVAQGGNATGSGRPGDAFGGAISVSGTGHLGRLLNSWFRANQSRTGSTPNDRGYVTAGGGAISMKSDRIRLIDRVTFSENIAQGGAASTSRGLGGAIFVHGGRLDRISNSTFYLNRAVGGTDNTPGDSGGPGSGGAIAFNGDLPLELDANTFVRNEAQGGMGDGGSGEGSAAAVSITRHTIIATGNLMSGNLTRLADGTPMLEDCREDSAQLISGGWNLVEAPGLCPFSGPGDVTGLATYTYPLADWGCLSTLPDGSCLPTVAIDQASLAIDQSSCASTEVAVDARETVRPFDLPAIVNPDDGCDIGAFEAIDADGDGFTEAADCAPTDPDLHAIDSCFVCGGSSSCVILADGFESGNTDAWSL